MSDKFLNAKQLCALPQARRKIFDAIETAYNLYDNPRINLPRGSLITTPMTSGFGIIPDASLQAIIFPPDKYLKYDQVIIAFRGTQRRSEWHTNINLQIGESRFGLRGHSGFISMAQSVSTEIFELLQRFDPNKTQFLFVGHSLGGALSHILAVFVKFLRAGSASHIVNITLGQPSVWHTTPVFNGSYLQAEALLGRDNIVRVICVGNRQDIVTLLAQVGSGAGAVLSFAVASLGNVGVFKHIGWEWKCETETGNDLMCHGMQFYGQIMKNDKKLSDVNFELSIHLR